MNQDLLQDLGECGLVDLDKLLQLVEVVTEQSKAFVERDIAGGQLGCMRRPRLKGPLLVQQSS